MEEIKPVAQLINKIFTNISAEDVEKSYEMENAWKEILLSIKSSNSYEGRNMLDHSHIVDLKNKTLLVETDHPGWIELFQMHKKYILTGLQKKIPSLEVGNIVFRIEGSSARLHGKAESDEERTKRNIEEREKRFERDEKILEKSGTQIKNEEKKNELPPELSNLFENLRQNMLTNSKE